MRQRAVAEGGVIGIAILPGATMPLGFVDESKSAATVAGGVTRISLWWFLEMAALHALWRGITM